MGRTLVGILSKNSKDEYSVDVYEYYNREKIYSDTIRILAGWNVINFFVNFGRKKVVNYIILDSVADLDEARIVQNSCLPCGIAIPCITTLGFLDLKHSLQ